ncbi:hypothetical protein [Phyllobacterium ifriqiyense]|uniref:hypothetical protein n=1 Tax=Phyllobacterium ifriqiyense TaxID=314238 RepID=UPI003397660B
MISQAANVEMLSRCWFDSTPLFERVHPADNKELIALRWVVCQTQEGDVVNENHPKKKPDSVINLRNQLHEAEFMVAMRSAWAPITTDDQFADLLNRLDKAEKNQR